MHNAGGSATFAYVCICSKFRKGYQADVQGVCGHKIARLQVTYLAGWGGGLTAAVLLGRPLDLPLSMFVNRHDVVIVAVWWLANYFPLGGPGYIMRTRPVQWVSLVLLQMLRAGSIATVMTKTAGWYPSATIAVLIMGALLLRFRLTVTRSRFSLCRHLQAKLTAATLWNDGLTVLALIGSSSNSCRLHWRVRGQGLA